MSEPKNNPELKAEDIVVGKTYRAKRFRGYPTWNNDRVVLWTNGTQVQYDSDTVRQGGRYPRVSMEAFLKWAAREVTPEELQAYFK